MEVTGINVITGKVTKRNFTQKERDDRSEAHARELPQRQARDKEIDIKTKREAAIEEMLMGRTSVKARAYQDAIK